MGKVLRGGRLPILAVTMTDNPKYILLQQIGDCVRRLRAERGWTRPQLAEQAGLSPRFLAQLEAGEGNISISRLAQVAEALGQPLHGLIPNTRPGKKSSNTAAGSKKIIALIGLRGAGKSIAGARLARRLKIPFTELDSRIEHAASMRLAQIFSMHGESYYRRLEYEALKKIFQQSRPLVLATGGSLVTDPRAWNLVKQNSVTIWLKATPEVYWNRLLKQGDTRPMKNNPSAMAELRALLAAREPLYAQADHTVDTSRLSLPQVVDAVWRALNQKS